MENLKISKMKIGTIKFEKGDKFVKSNFYPNYPEVEICLQEDVTIDVNKFNSYTSYFVSGIIVSTEHKGDLQTVNQCPYAYDIIKDSRFTPNENFNTAFPWLCKN